LSQLGAEWFASIANENLPSDIHQPFFRSNDSGYAAARAVLIDMEPKAIARANGIARHSGSWRYSSEAIVHAQSGSGNNWACGYYSMAPTFGQQSEDAIRREVEACDIFGGFLVLQSAGGGTGSGLGTYLSEALRGSHPKATMLNHVVWPHHSGGVIVQAYNALLTLSHLQQVSDGLILVSNDRLSAVCAHDYQIKHPSVTAMNQVAAHDLVSLMLPASMHRSIGDEAAPWDSANELRLLYDLVLHVCPHPAFNLLSLESTPRMPAQSLRFSTDTWGSVASQLLDAAHGTSARARALGCGGGGEGAVKALASLVVLRGRGAAHVVLEGMWSKFSEKQLYSSMGNLWQPGCLAMATSEVPLSQNWAHDKVATVISNSQAVVPVLEHTTTRATEMLQSGAYLHHYERFGMKKMDMEDALVHSEQALADYKSLSTEPPHSTN